MAVESRGRAELLRQWRERESSPERTTRTSAEQRKVDVVYYISRNGQLEHPHFMEVPLSSPEGLYLRDVINRLNVLRGRGMASMYSWSSKRSYKNGFVWHDLSEENFIHPVHGNEYVLKGTELLHAVPNSGEAAVFMSMSSERPLRAPEHERDDSSAAVSSRKRTSWGSFDVNEYRVYRSNELLQEAPAKATDASTQTDDKRNRREMVVEEEDPPATSPGQENPTTELSREEISPPPSSSSPETLETLINADGRRIVAVRRDDQYRMVGSSSSGRMKASAVLMSLFSCGSISVKEHGLSLVSQYRGRLPHSSAKETEDRLGNTQSFRSFAMENKEYFSGSLVETKKFGCHDMGELPSLRRSSSFNADRALKIDLGDETAGSMRDRCKSRMQKARKERNPPVTRSSTHGSKRIDQ